MSGQYITSFYVIYDDETGSIRFTNAGHSKAIYYRASTDKILALDTFGFFVGIADDVKYERQTLMVRLGWQRGMTLHNIAILLTYVILGLAAVLGLPWPLTWPGLLTFPVGVFQIWQILQIGNGVRPNWRLTRITAISTLALAGYMLAYALWTG